MWEMSAHSWIFSEKTLARSMYLNVPKVGTTLQFCGSPGSLPRRQLSFGMQEPVLVSAWEKLRLHHLRHQSGPEQFAIRRFHLHFSSQQLFKARS